MPGTDDYGQDVPWLDNGDTPDLRVGTKGLADALTPLSNMRFDTAAERNATITSPQEGMEAWLRTENLKTVYDGTGWAVVAAGTQSWTTVSLASGWAHNGNDNGTFQYRVINLWGEPSIMFQGAVSVTYSGNNPPNSGVLNTTALPVAGRPTSLRTIVVPCSDVSSVRITLKLDIQPDGFLKIYGAGIGTDGTSKPPWIGFNGCFCSL